MQKSALNNLLTLASSIIILCYVSIAKGSDVTSNLIMLSIINVLAVNLPLVLATVVVFSSKLKESRPQLSHYDRKYMKKIMQLGGAFFWVQIMYMIITTTNEFLITWLVGSDAVVDYQIYNKLFSLVGVLFTLSLTPIWSAVTKALSENNYPWILRLYSILKKLTLLAVISQFLMIPFLNSIINLWIGKNVITINYTYALIFAVSGSIFIWNGVISSISNGIGRLKVQSIFFTIGAIIKIPIAMLLVNITGSWIGIILANIISMLMYCVIEPIALNKFFKKNIMEEKRNV